MASRCILVEKEQTQPQFYGTSYFLVRFAPTGPLQQDMLSKQREVGYNRLIS